MSKESGFIEAIVSEPDEDSHRLIYADWLDENGNPERAELIRVQCELATLEEDSMHRRQLAFRSRELLDQHQEEWIGPIREKLLEWQFHRGFIEKVLLWDENVREYADDLFGAWPIRRVDFLEDDAIVFLSQLPEDHNVTGLSLYVARLDPEALQELVTFDHLSGLQSLSLMFNDLNDEDADFICEHEFFQKLSLIRLGGNPILNAGREKVWDHFGDRATFECERDDDHLYTIDDDRFTTGVGDQLTQLLIFPTRMVVFDHAGNVLDILYRELPEDESLSARELAEMRQKSREQWQSEWNLQPCGIRVKRFTFSDGAGIRGFNWWHEPFDIPEYSDRDSFWARVSNWIYDGQFEYNFVRDNVWLNREGEVTDT